jgi:lipid-A-disaccharide synthase
MTSGTPLRFALVAGEASGDILGAALVRALRARFPQAVFYGVTGPRMQEAGCDSVATIDALSVMGIAEVVPKIPSLLKLRRTLYERFAADRPDCFIGIDAPDFNLPLERRLRESGLRVAHLVSPTVWAWRQGRVAGIARSVDLMLCLFPFEPKFYASHGVRAEYIGHPLADELAEPIPRAAARAQFDVPQDAPCVAVLPGSRGGELAALAEPFAAAAAWLGRHVEDLHCVVPVAKPSLRAAVERAIGLHAPNVRWRVADGHSREAMAAADVVLLASGTATLECLLVRRPMVVAYRVAAATAWLLRRFNMIKTEYKSLPNLLAAQPTVPEFIQEQVVPSVLGRAVLELLQQPAARERQLMQFDAVARELRRDAGARAADAIAELIAPAAVAQKLG